ncbi:glycopeptide [Cyathus striatus]|nr:glycopeptide [Cyathus striatus]
MVNVIPTFFAIAIAVVATKAERHVIHFTNRCGRGTPTLVRAGKILSTGADYVSNGPFVSGIAYLQTGNCLLNGEHCGTVEMTLQNPVHGPGSGSSTDISLIPPLAYNVPIGFGYYGGCDGAGALCNNANCKTAFHVPTDTFVQVACQQNDVNLAITFC